MSKLGWDCVGAQYRVAGFIVVEVRLSAGGGGDDHGGGGGGNNDGGAGCGG